MRNKIMYEVIRKSSQLFSNFHTYLHVPFFSNINFVNEIVTFMFLFVLCLADCTIWFLQMLASVKQI